ncbi:MAG: transporter [Oleiphilus sp.]|nr:MAG: transporter [Oleiphilus sp.]
MKNWVALISGLLFGVGLAVSGMTDTAKVLGFLDFFGEWDATLAFVMAAGLAVTIPAYRLTKDHRPWFETGFSLPKASQLDVRLIGGAIIFGLGWGLYGYCPGPAVAAIAYGRLDAIVFVIMMAAGMYLAEKLIRVRDKAGASST